MNACMLFFGAVDAFGVHYLCYCYSFYCFSLFAVFCSFLQFEIIYLILSFVSIGDNGCYASSACSVHTLRVILMRRGGV